MSATDKSLVLRLAADLRRREFLARACNSAASAANPSDWRVLAAVELERLAAVELERDAYRSELTAVMPADFKDWHKGHPKEWPELAAMVIAALRAERDDLATEVERLRAAPAAAVETVCARCGGIVSDPLLPGACAAPAPAVQGEPLAFFHPVTRALRLNPLHSVQVATSAWRGEVPLHAAPAAKPQPSHGWVDEDIARTELQRAIEAELKNKE